MRPQKIPPGARLIRTYAEFESYLKDFAEGRYPFLVIIGRPGLGKTESIQVALRRQRVCYRKGGQLTPLQLHLDCYRHRGDPIVLDDADPLLDDKIGRKLVSALGDTTRAKLLSYGSTSRKLGAVPQQFLTTSPLCILTNTTTLPADLRSRAVVMYFVPSNLEIHRSVARWYWEQDIHDWFGQHLSRLPELDTRWYVIASQDKRAARDWRQIILRIHAPNRASGLVQDLESDPAYPTGEDKARRFVELMAGTKGASRATYYRLRQRLEQEHRLLVESVPSIPLRQTRPPGTPSPLELDAMEAEPPPEPEEEPQPIDVPARERFTQPINGHNPSAPRPPRIILDDLMPWERPQDEEEDEE